MTSRIFIEPQRLELIESVLSVCEKFGITECLVRTKTPGFVEVEAMGWNLLSTAVQVDLLGELLLLNVSYLIRMKP